MLNDSGRTLAYSRLRAVDAVGRALDARIQVIGGDRLAVVVEDSKAACPVRIDPTFSDENWVSMGGLAGTDGVVNAAVVDASGNLYIGGRFRVVGDAVATNIAKWDGKTWSSLGWQREIEEVYALAVSDTNVYVGHVGGVVKWDGTAWSVLDDMDGRVNALVVSGTNLYAGGYFEYVKSSWTQVNGIAKWDGSVWTALAEGLEGDGADALAVSGTDLYVGGGFKAAGGAATGIAKWDGNVWSPLGSWWNRVHALAVSGTNVYAGCNGGVTRWDGAAWSGLGSGASGTDVVVKALAASGTNLYAAGGSRIGQAYVGFISLWNGNTWSKLGSGMNGWVTTLALGGANVYAGGDFTQATNTGPTANPRSCSKARRARRTTCSGPSASARR